jgi:hypothetical protein
VEHRNHTYAFACRLEGPGLMGKDARTTVEKILDSAGLL